MKQFIRTLLMLVAISISCSVARAATPLRNGDLIFQESCRGTMNDAIKGVTTSISGYQFTHVGIVWIHQKDTFFFQSDPKLICLSVIVRKHALFNFQNPYFSHLLLFLSSVFLPFLFLPVHKSVHFDTEYLTP